MPKLVEAYVPRLVSQLSNLTGDEMLMELACVYLEAVKGRRVRGALDSWGLHLKCHPFRRSRSIT